VGPRVENLKTGEIQVPAAEEPTMHRKSLISLLFVLLVATLSGCGAEGGEPAKEEQTAKAAKPEVSETPTEVSFATQVAPLFAAKCNFCHHPDNAVKVDLTQSFDPEVGIIRRPNSWTKSEKKMLVVPGDPEGSALIWKVEQTELDPKIDGNPMPWNIDPLTEKELADLRQWIVQGARDDALYQSSITRIFGDGVSLGSRGGKCAYCHYPGAASGPDLTDPLDSARGIVNINSRFGGVRIVPGDPEASVLFAKVRGGTLAPELGRPMPLHFERLTSEEIQILRDWISEGAQDN
jgi:hypothetical protein